MKRVSFYTLGCKLNQAETASLATGFRERGYDVVDFGDQADVCVVNTCSVTEKADADCRQVVRRAIRQSPGAFIVLAGCYAQQAPANLRQIPGVDLILGADEKFHIFDRFDFRSPRKLSAPEVHTCHSLRDRDFVNPWIGEFKNRTRAFLKIQDGCDAFCSFCSIPYSRGTSRSGDFEELVDHARQLVGKGYREIVLSGVYIGDYGKDLTPRRNLSDLAGAISTIPGLARLRISSIEPNHIDEHLIALFRENRVICPHVHIPLQSGSDEILHSMNRRYTSDQYSAVVHLVKDAVPDICIGVDVIVGFPGERDAQFEETRRRLESLPVSYLHVFSYSMRPGTRAAGLPDQVPAQVKRERSAILRNLSRRKRVSFMERALGRQYEVLLEEVTEDGRAQGFTENYIRVRLPLEGRELNQVYPVRITALSGDDDLAFGRVVDESTVHSTVA